MPLESVTHISDLVVTNPTSTDPKSEGDNHLRNIKTALKTDFPNISGPVTKTHTQLNNALDKTGDTMTGTLNVGGGGSVLVTGAGGMGYGVGSGGTVTQATSKSTLVTLNKPSGQIKMSSALLGAGARVDFDFINSTLAATDTIILSITGFISYSVVVRNISTGACTLALTNNSGSGLSEAVNINFTVIKGATS